MDYDLKPEHLTQMLESLKNTEDPHISKKRRCLPIDTDSTTPTLHCIIDDLYSDDVNDQIDATTRLCALLSIGDNPPIEEVVQSGVVTRLVGFLDGENSSLQLQATWALTNIASGTSEQTQAVVDSGAVEKLLNLLDSHSDDVSEQAVWALGNVAGDSQLCREHVWECNAIDAFLEVPLCDKPLPFVQKATWALCNLCKEHASYSTTSELVEALRSLINLEDEEILTNVCWAFYYILDGSAFEHRDVAEANVLPRLLELLNHQSELVMYAAIRTTGHLLRKETKLPVEVSVLTKEVIDKQGLPFIRNLLDNADCPVNIKKEACWIISQICATDKTQIQAVIDEDIIYPLVQLLKSPMFVTKKEAALALKMACHRGTSEHVKHIVNKGCIKPICKLLTSSNYEIATHCLGLIGCILRGPYIIAADNHGEVDGEVDDFADNIADNIAADNIVADIMDAGGWDKSNYLENHGEVDEFADNIVADNIASYRQMIMDAGGWDKINYLKNHGEVNELKVLAKHVLCTLEDGQGPPW